jgi:cystathionine beta-lyase family protein involved in aluminum resistance
MYKLLSSKLLTQVAEAVKVLLPEFMEIDGLVATNINRVLDAYANARVGSHVCISYLVHHLPDASQCLVDGLYETSWN